MCAFRDLAGEGSRINAAGDSDFHLRNLRGAGRGRAYCGLPAVWGGGRDEEGLMTAAGRTRIAAWAKTAPGYAAALGLVAATAGAAWIAGPGLAGANLAMLFLAPVLVSAVGFGLGPALMAALAAAVSFNFLFIEPRFTFWIGHPADLLTFSMFFAVAVATGWLAGRERDQAQMARRHAATVGTLLAASRALAAATTPDEVAQALADQLMSVGAGAAVVVLPSAAGPRVAGRPAGLDRLGPAAAQAAREVLEAGRATDDDATGYRFRPLEGANGRVAAIGLRATDTTAEDLISGLLRQGAVALERSELAAATVENQALRRADDLRSALLNSISHDFRTPLSTVLGSVTTLQDYGDQLKPAVRRDLLDSIREEAQRLNRYVGDLLDMARLEAGALKPKREWADVRAVVASALARIGERTGGRRIVRDFAPDLSRVKLDRTLLEQAILNVLENAVAYGPDGSRIEVAAYEDAGAVMIAIEDEGPGIAPEALKVVFDRFRRLERASDRGEGLGLGLSIARGFVEAMGGRIAATSPVADGRGTRFLISLPKSTRTPKGLL
jgi:two-component system sensor histidine kinase KdpD